MCLACAQRAVQRLLAPPFAALYDRIMARTEAKGLGALRRQLLHDLSGDVLEIGAGTGVNLTHYGPDARLTLTEPEAPMARRLRDRAARVGRSAQVVEGPAEALPVDRDSQDVVVSTLVLCTVRDPTQAVAEIHRVLRPGGRLVFVEHILAADAPTQRVQRLVEPLWSTLGGNCHLTRDTPRTLHSAGLRLEGLTPYRLPKAPRFIRQAVYGVAGLA